MMSKRKKNHTELGPYRSCSNTMLSFGFKYLLYISLCKLQGKEGKSFREPKGKLQEKVG